MQAQSWITLTMHKNEYHLAAPSEKMLIMGMEHSEATSRKIGLKTIFNSLQHCMDYKTHGFVKFVTQDKNAFNGLEGPATSEGLWKLADGTKPGCHFAVIMNLMDDSLKIQIDAAIAAQQLYAQVWSTDETSATVFSHDVAGIGRGLSSGDKQRLTHISESELRELLASSGILQLRHQPTALSTPSILPFPVSLEGPGLGKQHIPHGLSLAYTQLLHLHVLKLKQIWYAKQQNLS